MDQTREKNRPVRVAVVGTGMAGLVTAWLLHNDSRRRYDVHVFESGPETSLDAASMSVIDPQTKKIDRVDVPMRAFTEGYYYHLKAMYDHLGIRYHVQPFLFSFARLVGQTEQQYFVHASNNHQLPPRRPEGMDVISYLCELIVVLICYLWFNIACLCIPTTRSAAASCETLDEYLRRIRIPQYFVRSYLLPLMSAVTTCTHKELLHFPAKDVVDYKRCITSGRQLVVSEGVRDVQQRLLKDIKVSYCAGVTAIEPRSEGVKLVWKRVDVVEKVMEDVFEKVILAVPPNVVGSICRPLRKQMSSIPTTRVVTLVHRDRAAVPAIAGLKTSKPWMSLGPVTAASQVIHLRTGGGSATSTEATHVQPSGATVTSCPLQPLPTGVVMRSSTFTRVLRTPQSRKIINNIFASAATTFGSDMKDSQWKNGDDNVYLAGAWCWDGMVLLEGCVVSAVRTAKALGVNVPWNTS